jgi:hypothetical protein
MYLVPEQQREKSMEPSMVGPSLTSPSLSSVIPE